MKPCPSMIEAHEGMTLRDYFAAAALQGMLAYSYVNPTHGNFHENSVVAQFENYAEQPR